MIVDNILPRAVARLRQPVDSYYMLRHPGPLIRTMLRTAAPLAAYVPSNDKWSLPAHIRHWMRALDVPPRAPLPPAKHLFLFACYRGEFTLNIALATMLAWRGHTVTLGYLPRLGSPSKPPFTNAHDIKDYLATVLADLGVRSQGRIVAVDLSDYCEDGLPLDEAFIERQARSDTVMRRLSESLDESDPEIAETLDYYRELGLEAQSAAMGYLSQNKQRFDLALIANGLTFATAQVVNALQNLSIPFNTFEKFAFSHVRLPAHGDVVFSFADLDCLWNNLEPLGFTDDPLRKAAVSRGWELLEERRNASQKNFVWQYQKAAGQTSEETLRLAGLKPGEPFALICPNVPFDAGYFDFCTLFDSMREWLVETVQVLLKRSDIKIVVRSHPGEMQHYGGREHSSHILEAAGLAGHPRVSIVAPDAPLNTYGLMEHCQFGSVFSSTTCIEMAMMGKPVVVGADVYFSKRGFTLDCDNRVSYGDTLAAIASKAGLPVDSQQISDDARLFYYMIHFVLQRPYPYDKASDLVRLPLHRLFASDAVETFLPTLDTLTMNRDEYVAAIESGHPPFPIGDGLPPEALGHKPELQQ